MTFAEVADRRLQAAPPGMTDGDARIQAIAQFQQQAATGRPTAAGQESALLRMRRLRDRANGVAAPLPKP